MAKTKLFISSVQAEFATERQALYEYLLADPLLGRFFEPFLFEHLPAQDQHADAVYLREVPPKYPLSSTEVKNLIKVLETEMTRSEIQTILGLKDIKNFRENYLEPALNDGFIKIKYPENPNHPNQKYRLSLKGTLFRKVLIKDKYEGVNEGVNLKIEGVNEGVLSELQYLYDLLAHDGGKKAVELKDMINKSLATTERYLKMLKEHGYIEFRGAPKTGGYF